MIETDRLLPTEYCEQHKLDLQEVKVRAGM